MQHWVTFGASIIGPAHLQTGKPNQDSWCSFHRSDYDILVVSDGLGSKPFSEFGSEAACRAVDIAAKLEMSSRGHIDLISEDSRASFFDALRDSWLAEISPIKPSEASATCLFAIRENHRIWIGMIGDGCAALVDTSEKVTSLQEIKDEGFSNMTVSLAEGIAAHEWQVACIADESCEAVLLCTDGVSDDLVDIDGFVKGLLSHLKELSPVTASSEISDILTNWPTPKHSDDKTIACMIKRGFEDEE